MNYASAATLIVGPGETYTTIQAAINAASSGDTIEVHSGTYNGGVLVDKTLTLEGVGSPVVDAGGLGDAIMLTAGSCTVRGFVVKNASTIGIGAITGGNTISGNTASGNVVAGIALLSLSGNTISDNTVTGNGYGISIQTSDSNTLSGNAAINNLNAGIMLVSSSGNTISDGTISGNGDGGILLLLDSNGNTLSNNTINGNSGFGIILLGPSGNTIYLNSFNNVDNSMSTGADGANTWHSPTQIVWGSVTTYVGNRWSDYKGQDGNGDCIGDTPYDNITVGSEKDYYPIVCEHSSECNLTLTKTADKPTAHRGEEITYNIDLSSCPDGVSYTNVTVWDILPQGVELVSVSPESSSSSPTNLTWDIGTLGPGQHFGATVVVRVPIVDINYDMAQEVQGEGFVNVHNDYDTHQGPESVTNCAYARADLIETISS
ncbi:MAG: right-handed parallel beta-helix repeat-containing protein, partial [Methanothrix sp.]|nr:right-handed parallel beta-helix repeat-containing protein [Methanothrix sp.]